MTAARDKEYLLYKRLLDPSHEWAFNFILNTISLRLSESTAFHVKVHTSGWFHLVGSVAEGMSLNTSDQFHPNKTSELFHPDFDIMLIHPDAVIVPCNDGNLNLVDRNSQRVGLLFGGLSVTGEAHPGYLRIAVPDRGDLIEGFIVRRNGTVYLADITASIASMMSRFDESDHVETRKRHGPAIELTLDAAHSETPVLRDMVPAFKIFPWPAKSWSNRRRPSGWPPEELIAKIVSGGCHAVKKAHAKTSEPDAEIEFRYSFSFAELELCKSLTTQQKQCMKLFKLIVLVASDDIPFKEYGLSSYHLKTVFLWLCEKLPATEWTGEAAGRCVLALLDQLLEFLNSSNLPNYFIPENNIVDHISASDMQSLIGLVRKIRDNPIAYLFFSDCCPFEHLFKLCPIRMFNPVLEVINCQSINTRNVACIQVLQTAARSVSSLKDGWKEALRFMETQSFLLQSLGFNMSSSLLLTILFIDRFKGLMFTSSWSLICRPFSINDRRFLVFAQLANFLSAIGHFQASNVVLHKADTLLSEDQDSKTVQARFQIRADLLRNYSSLGNFEEAHKCALKCLRHYTSEVGCSDEDLGQKAKHLMAAVCNSDR